MTGILGTRAPLLSDLSLVLQIVTTVLFTIGYFYERRRGKHCVVMAVAVVTNMIFVLSYMASRLFRAEVPEPPVQFADLYRSIVIPHGILSVLVLILATTQVLLAYRWRTKKNGIIALGDRRILHRRVGLITLTVWYLSLLSGLSVYVLLYVL